MFCLVSQKTIFGSKVSYFCPYHFAAALQNSTFADKGQDKSPRLLSFGSRFCRACHRSFVPPSLCGSRQIKVEQQIGRDKNRPSFVPPQKCRSGQNSASIFNKNLLLHLSEMLRDFKLSKSNTTVFTYDYRNSHRESEHDFWPVGGMLHAVAQRTRSSEIRRPEQVRAVPAMRGE